MHRTLSPKPWPLFSNVSPFSLFRDLFRSNEETQKVAINFAEALQIGKKYSWGYQEVSGQSIFQEPDNMFVYSSENMQSISNIFIIRLFLGH